MKDDVVKHVGIVSRINGNHIQVKITQTSSCSSCSIKSHCTSAESKEHIVDVYDKEAAQYHVGDEVWIIGSTSMSRKAVWYGYMLPLLILMALIIGLSTWWEKNNELSIAIYSLGAVIVYYRLLYFFGNSNMKKTFNFMISKIN